MDVAFADFNMFYLNMSRWRSIVGIVTGYGAERLRGRSSSPGRVKNFLFSAPSTPALGSAQPPIYWVPGALSLGVKRPRCEADHSPPVVLRSRKSGSIHPLLYMTIFCVVLN
jgi:hypothetical protein